MRAEGESYNEIAEELGRSKADIYRVCMALGCAPDQAAPLLVSVVLHVPTPARAVSAEIIPELGSRLTSAGREPAGMDQE
jgi:hypothetical protein